ncbi:unnamed protein product [Bemisia tabaci]|uniref:Sulfatase N-terminal domain-containing protein n=2 Tax=Bemisia tabaci TaxID=7038 RepID=A0A9P0A398_BEMTA|nr:unnamed protein product [Bemisia tabaci]
MHVTNMFHDGIFKILFFITHYLCLSENAFGVPTQPHIIFMVADDMGWNDASFRGANQIPTPNIDAIAYNGIVLDRHYTLPSCSPSRAALLTGKYPIRMGMQGHPLLAGHADGIPLEEKLLPEYLRELGYVTRLVGKWHVGYHNTSMTPLSRGFDSHFGYYNGYVGYRDAVHEWFNNSRGYDCYRDGERRKEEVVGKYLTDVYTEEAVKIINNHEGSERPLFLLISHLAPHTGAIGVLESRDEAVTSKKYRYIKDPLRRTYAGVMGALDDSLGAVVEALDATNMLQNSIIVFISDNGGPTSFPSVLLQNSASNWPLRGAKMSVFEGGVRGVAAVWSPLLKNPKRSSAGYMHISDWLPTLYSAAGGNVEMLKDLDGLNQWDYLVYDGSESPRNELLVNIWERVGDWAIIKDEWKLVKVNSIAPLNHTQLFDGESGRLDKRDTLNLVANSAVSKALRRNQPFGALRREYEMRRADLDMTRTTLCANRIATSESTPFPGPDPCTEKPCLFNIQQDPCEFHDMADQHPSVVDELKELYESHAARLVKEQDHGFDPAAEPELWEGWWAPWLDSS